MDAGKRQMHCSGASFVWHRPRKQTTCIAQYTGWQCTNGKKGLACAFAHSRFIGLEILIYWNGFFLVGGAVDESGGECDLKK